MKKVFLMCGLLCLLSAAAWAQTAKMQYEGIKDIRAISGNYFIYLTLADIKEAYMQLPPAEQQRYAELLDLPIGIRATINIVQGSKAQASIMEPVIQRHVGAWLLKQGMAYIITKDDKVVTTLDYVEGEPLKDEAGFEVRPISFYEAGTKKRVFSGTINTALK